MFHKLVFLGYICNRLLKIDKLGVIALYGLKDVINANWWNVCCVFSQFTLKQKSLWIRYSLTEIAPYISYGG